MKKNDLTQLRVLGIVMVGAFLLFLSSGVSSQEMLNKNKILARGPERPSADFMNAGGELINNMPSQPQYASSSDNN